MPGERKRGIGSCSLNYADLVAEWHPAEINVYKIIFIFASVNDMSNDILTVKTSYYMPYRIIMCIALAAGAAGLIKSERYTLGFVVLVLAALVLTSHYGIRINKKNKTYNDFLSILGIVSGEEKSYQAVDYVFIVSGKMSQTKHSLITSRSFTDDYFDGYIKFDGVEKVYLLTNKNKAKVVMPLEQLSRGLGVELLDRSTSDEN